MIADAISAVIKNTMAQEKHEAKEPNETQKMNLEIDAAEAVLRQLVKSNYGSATTWFQKIKGKSGSVSRQNWKAAIQQIGLAVDDETRKAIRKRIARDAEDGSRGVARGECPPQTGTRGVGTPPERPAGPVP